MHDIHDIKSICNKIYLDLTCNVKMGIWNTKKLKL
jgi:hypothetical protein